MTSEEARGELEALEQKVHQRAQENQRLRDEHLASFDPSVQWMVLVPVWTEELARACAFPSPAPHILERLRQEGLCQSREVFNLDEGAPAQKEYWMPPDIRQRELVRLMDRGSSTLEKLRRESHQLGSKLSGLNVPMPASTWRWAQLAAAGHAPEALASALHARLAHLLAAPATLSPKKDEEERVAEAMSWVRTAQHLALVFGPTLVSSVSTATRRIDFIQIRWDDKRRLTRYLQREEQVHAFQELAASPPDDAAWALHFIGKAGIGKTMLVRHLCARITQEHGYWARVDFDHLNPAYPTQAPWLLVEQLADQLHRQDATGRVSRELNWFDKLRLSVRELAGSLNQSWEKTQQHSIWQQLLDAFANVLRAFDGPVFFLLDTCEELAKITAGEVSANVSATFQILEDLHERFPRLRVLFFGRRPLASSGAGWSLEQAPSWLPRRNFLRLHETQSFTQQEAREYFDRSLGTARRENQEELFSAVLEKSREPARRSPFRHGGATPSPQPRFNPFEVVLYSDWIQADPRITPQMLAQPGTDRYIELRIVERIRDPLLQQLLPAVAVLGRFDEALLRHTWGSSPESFEPAFRELIRQEWVRHETRYYQVDEGLLPRLEAYFRATRPASMLEAARRAAEFLETFTLESPFEEVQPFQYVLLGGLLRDDVGRAVYWWRRIEERVTQARLYAPIGEVCRQLLAEDGPLPLETPPEPAPLRAVILATYAAALVHQRRSARTQWALVEQLAPREDERLHARALLGQISSARAAGEGVGKALEERFWTEAERWPEEDWDEQLMAAWVAALDAVLEELEDAGKHRRIPGTVPRRMVAWAYSERGSPALSAFVLATASRTLLRSRSRWKKAWTPRAWFMDCLRKVPIGPTPQHWLDWRSPEDIGARIRLEFLRSLHPDVLSASEVIQLWVELHGESVIGRWPEINPTLLDQDRLCAALLQTYSAVQPAHEVADQFTSHGWNAESSRYGIPDCNAHRAFPPSFIALAQVLGMSGEYHQAIDLLRGKTVDEETAALSTHGATLADSTRLELLRRMRILDDQRTADLLVRRPPPEATFELLCHAWALMGLSSPALADTLHDRESPVLLPWKGHVCWRALPALTAESAQHCLRWAGEHLPYRGERPTTNIWQLSLMLDACEASLLAQSFGLKSPFKLQAFSEALRFLRTTESPHDLRLVLRAWVLGFEFPPQVLQFLAHKVGVRAAAQIALDEGELLALRLPAHGAALLEKACDFFLDAHDNEGALLSSLAWALAVLRLPDTDPAQALDLVRISRQKLERHLPRDMGKVLSLFREKHPSREHPWKWVLLRLEAVEAAASDLRRGSTQLKELLARTLGPGSFLPTELYALLLAVSGQKAPPAFTSGVSWLPEADPRLFPLVETGGPGASLLFTAHRGKAIERTYSLAGTGPVKVALSIGEDVLPEELVLEPQVRYEATASVLVSLLRSQKTFARWRGPEAAFRVDTMTAGVCWEAVVAAALGHDPKDRFDLDLRRSGLEAYPFEARKVHPMKSVAIVTGSSSFQRFLAGRWMIFWEVVRELDPQEPSYWESPTDVLHLIGSATPTSRGPRMEFQSTRSVDDRHFARGFVLSASDLMERMQPLRACIISGPQAPLLPRNESDRLQASLARAFASELIEMGKLTAVLVIPSLPEQPSFEVIDQAIRALHLKDWPMALANAVRRMRTLIFKTLGETPDAREVAMDVCLYMPPQAQIRY